MKKVLKTICACFVMLVICFGALGLAACGKDDEQEKLMAVSMNPSLEFVLDNDDKVVSVTATNDDGNFILTKVSFEGKTAQEAVNEFLRVAKENGFMIAGNVSASENQLKISISGEQAQELFNQVKASAEEYLSGVNINAQINLDDIISKEDLEARVQELRQELTAAEIDKMSEEDLLELIEDAHEETEELLSQELKELYYKTRAEEIVKAKFEAVKTLLNQYSTIVGSHLNIITSSLTDFTSNIASFKETFTNNILSGTYAQELQDYVTAKKALLEEQLKVSIDANTLQTLETTVAEAKQAMQAAKTTAEGLLAQANAAIDTAIAQMNTALNGVLTVLSTFMDNANDTINNAIETIKDGYKATFETEFASYITQAEELWASMQPTVPQVA